MAGRPGLGEAEEPQFMAQWAKRAQFSHTHPQPGLLPPREPLRQAGPAFHRGQWRACGITASLPSQASHRGSRILSSPPPACQGTTTAPSPAAAVGASVGQTAPQPGWGLQSQGRGCVEERAAAGEKTSPACWCHCCPKRRWFGQGLGGGRCRLCPRSPPARWARPSYLSGCVKASCSPATCKDQARAQSVSWWPRVARQYLGEISQPLLELLGFRPQGFHLHGLFLCTGGFLWP